MIWLFNRFNSTGGVPASCIAANPTNMSRCIFAEGVAPTLKTPFFPLQSEYDSWQVRGWILVVERVKEVYFV